MVIPVSHWELWDMNIISVGSLQVPDTIHVILRSGGIRIIVVVEVETPGTFKGVVVN